MTGINKAVGRHCVPSWRGHVRGHCPIDTPVKIMPIVLFEHALADLWMNAVKG
jgi:hypothetical protein